MSVEEDAAARVCRIHVVGVQHTHVDLLRLLTLPLFEANTVAGLLSTLTIVRQQLSSLGVFSHVRSIVDVSKRKDRHEPKYDVTFLVREKRRVSASIRSELETNGLALRVGGRFLNVTGRADQAGIDVIRGTHSENGYSIGYHWPLEGDINRQLSFGISRTSFENILPFLVPCSTYRQRESSGFISHEFPLPYGFSGVFFKYGLRLEHNWRKIEAQQQTTPLSLRSLEGDSVKSSLRHFLVIDTRDSSTLPSSGYLARFTQEFAVPPGDSRCVKHEVELQVVRALRQLPLTLHGSFNAGHAYSINNKFLALSDRYFIGGPLTLRGFLHRGVGYGSPVSTINSADSQMIGGSCYWVGALHAYAPLPFLGRPTVSTSSDQGEEENTQNSVNPVQLHGFLTAGDLALSASQLFQSLTTGCNGDSSVRISLGAGIVMRLGSIARLELNYTLPLRAQQTDSSKPGFQFGVGVQFV